MVNNSSLQIKRKNDASGKTYTTTITYINPSATSENLLTLATKITALQSSGQTTTSITRITKEVIA